jgi:hypothetical protein
MERLAATVRELAADRDRLRERVAGLEQELTDVTGSIARQSATAPAPPELPAKAAPAATAAAPPAVPVLKPPVGVPPLGSDVVIAPEIGSQMSESVPQPAPKTWPQPDHTLQPGTASAEAAPADAMPPTGAPGEQGEAAADPQVLVEVPMPRRRMAAISPKSEYAVDLGGAFSHEALAARWSELKGKFGSRLRGLRPLIKLETRFGYAPYRLVIGPLADEAAAKQLCTHLSGKIDCQPTRFAGNRLAQH